MLARFTAALLQKWSDSKGKIIVTLILVGTVVYFWNDYKDTKKALRETVARASTLDEDYRKLGVAYAGQGEVLKTEREANRLALQAQGEAVIKEMESKHARLQAMFTAQGVILEEVRRKVGATGPVTPDPVTGAFSGVTMVQSRANGPALTDVTLFYDPKHPDPTKRLLGDWRNYRETFNQSVGEWRREDGGIVGTFRLWREVSRDGQVVGREEIPLVNARTSVAATAFDHLGPSLPRWTVQAGAAWDWQKRQWGPAVIGDYRLTNRIGIGGGFAGNQVLLLGSVRLGGK